MSSTLNASTLLAVPLAPLAGAVLAGIFGTTFGGNWIGRRLAHSLTILGVLVAFILFAVGTGPIKGFAVTLSIGIVCSMFTAITVTRGLVQLVYGRKRRIERLSI